MKVKTVHSTRDHFVIANDEMARCARDLAQQHLLGASSLFSVLQRLNKHTKLLQRGYVACDKTGETARRQLPVVDCLLTNFYFIQEQIQKNKQLLNNEQNRCRRGLSNVSPASICQLYELAHAMVQYTDMRLDSATMDAFIGAYQQCRSLGTGELMILPVLTRIVLIIQISTVIGAAPSDENASYATLWNAIHSLRMLAGDTGHELIAAHSQIEKILQEDINGIYAAMDLPTKDRYRKTVLEISAASRLSEVEVARLAIKLAADHALLHGQDNRQAHVGYYLVDRGRWQLEKTAGVKKLSRSRHAFPKYLAMIGCATLVVMSLPLTFLTPGVSWYHILTAVLLLPCTIQLAVALTHYLLSLWTESLLLPCMDVSGEIPANARTLVVIPAIPGSIEEVIRLTNTLELHFIGNRGSNIHFGLLTDFRDANSQSTPDDMPLLECLQKQIESLNARHNNGSNSLFFLFHRPRTWHPKDRIWMGYERKRGKLNDLNRLLRGEAKDRFCLIVGEPAIFLQIKYVITLDADTQLPRDTAGKLIGTMMHPLNQPVYDEQRQRVTEGYGVLQPRVGVDLAVINQSEYSHLFASHAGIDCYTQASPDTYQDQFGEGSFIGKGIYEVDTCLRGVTDRFPENRILSHDLLEGCYLRAGLISDVCLYEDFPSSYLQDKKRHHRWIRGDWQAAAWMLPLVPDALGGWQRNTLSGLSRWKIFDNLCRSVNPIALAGLFLSAWFIFRYPLRWTIFLIVLNIVPGLLIWAQAVLWQLKTNGTLLKIKHYPVPKVIVRAMYNLMWLPGEAFCAVSAIGTALWRMAVSHTGLLQWDNTAGKTVLPRQRRLEACIRWSGLIAGIIIAISLFFIRPAVLPVAAAMLTAWVLSPWAIRMTALPKKSPRRLLTNTQHNFLRRIVRITWRYFETFVGPQENWLPPDHYQEYPVKRIAHWTSPTNIGLSLLAGLSALDLGYLTPGSFMDRTAKTLGTLYKLERYRGHFYNWYDTITLQPARPRYVSTVDSGNLAGHLLTLRQGILEIPHGEILGGHSFRGLADTLELLIDEMTHPTELPELMLLLNKAAEVPQLTWKQVSDYLEEVEAQMEAAGLTDFASSYWQQAFLTQVAEMKEELQLLAPWLALPPAPESLGDLLPAEEIFTLDNILSAVSVSTHKIGRRRPRMDDAAGKNWMDQLEQQLLNAGIHAINRVREAERLAGICLHFADMEYDFLYDEKSMLLSIGFKPEDEAKDIGCYDLLASEARLGVFVAVAQGKLPQKSWFALGRPPVHTAGSFSLLSWNGTLFEYLMPLLVMPVYDDSLLHQAMKAAVKCQMQYGREHDIPWGISECAQNIVEASQTYQYGPAGVPDLAIKGTQEKSLVIAPYATALALTVAPEQACCQLEELYAKGFSGTFGFYEAIDYTPSRQAAGASFTVVRSFMVHHQGMSLLAMAGAQVGEKMQRRFMADQELKATLLLLQEKKTEGDLLWQKQRKARHTEQYDSGRPLTVPEMKMVFNTPDTAVPETFLLSNGRYHVMVTNAGGGYSRWKNIALTRWEEDKTCDNRGMFVYLRDADSSRYWSATHQPVNVPLEQYEVSFTNGNAVFRGTKEQLQTSVVTAVSPEEDLEVRTITIRNNSPKQRHIEVTSFAEVVLSRPEDDTAHPAFNKLFVETEYIPSFPAIIYTRRQRAANGEAACLFHTVKVLKGTVTAISAETDRMTFIGRGNTLAAPQAVKKGGLLSNSQGKVLDPIAAIRYGITLLPGEEAVLQLFLGAGETREQGMEMLQRCQLPHMAAGTERRAAVAHQLLLEQLGIGTSEAVLYHRLAGRMIYAGEALRFKADQEPGNRLDQSRLWKFFVSGDTPLIVLRICGSSDIMAVRQLVNAHRYWKAMGLKTELVILQDDNNPYAGFLKDHVQEVITLCKGADMINQPGGIFVIAATVLMQEEQDLLLTSARVVIDGNSGLSAQIFDEEARVYATGSRERRPAPIPPVMPPNPYGDTAITNNYSAFNDEGTEYVILTNAAQRTPAPWVNVIANPDFGTVISESGQAYTWAGNAQLYRLTPWTNDPVTDASGEAWYLCDEETGYYFSPLPQLQDRQGEYRCRHGWGYSIFEHEEIGLNTEARVYVDSREPVKYMVVKVRNNTSRQRRLSVTGYVEWVLGDCRQRSAMHIITTADITRNAIFAENRFSPSGTHKVAFFATDSPVSCFTADRTSFIGRNATLNTPKGMEESSLSGNIGAALDPCAALRVMIELKPGEEWEMTFMLGAGNNITTAQSILDRCKGRASMALDEVHRFWQRTTGCIQVRTPDPALDVLANGWLIYQVISSRIWGRSGYYQSGGALGFRDQLQDVMAIVHAVPEMARAQLLLHASRQFKEGDVLHWWHEEEMRGVRTRCSDDLLWLPFVTCRYVQSTGDMTVLDEQVRFLDGSPLGKGEEQHYDRYFPAEEQGTLYEHCVRAIKKGCTSGPHGLPLMGAGDWNDSMNKVGTGGKGESVWLAFFLYSVLKQFNMLAVQYEDVTFSSFCSRETERLERAIDTYAWDGEWYRRGYFDDGTPLGSAGNTVCKIDSITQSWSVLSGAGDRRRCKTSLESACKYLINKEFSLVTLLTPPFLDNTQDAGYINGYGAGIRENGGQYTQAAIWLMMALAVMGNGEKAWEIFAMINPVNRSRSREQRERYRVEPYVMAADIYMASGQEGRGGWTWYTGSAGWLYSAVTETLLGFRKTGNRLCFQPCLPVAWSSCVINYHYGRTMYHIKVKRIQEPIYSVVVDGIVQEDHTVHLVDDGLTHLIHVNSGITVPSNVPVPAQYESPV